MKEIIEELREIWDSEEGALRCGGTYSSHNLRKAIELSKRIEKHKKHPDYEKVVEHIVLITEIWRKALKNHNSNKLKCVEYDVETGLPIS